MRALVGGQRRGSVGVGSGGLAIDLGVGRRALRRLRFRLGGDGAADAPHLVLDPFFGERRGLVGSASARIDRRSDVDRDRSGLLDEGVARPSIRRRCAPPGTAGTPAVTASSAAALERRRTGAMRVP